MVERLDHALAEMFGDNVTSDVDLSGQLHPTLRFGGRSLNFSQLPDGVRVALGWLADIVMRQEDASKVYRTEDDCPGVVLIDEIESHLHPKWQRIILPALKAAFPNVQFIVTTHSPFVISSCDGARVHILDRDNSGIAYLKESTDAPVGDSVAATLQGILGVTSRFASLDTEEQLREWNELKKIEARRDLTSVESRKLAKLTQELASRGEELRAIVSAASSSALQELLTGAKPGDKG
jgi:predicted ATP-binding protein involved in virulence